MAAIDKLYGTRKQRDELAKWAEDRWESFAENIYSEEYVPDDGKTHAISNFPTAADLYLWLYCDIFWVTEQIAAQYDIQDKENWREAFALINFVESANAP